MLGNVREETDPLGIERKVPQFFSADRQPVAIEEFSRRAQIVAAADHTKNRAAPARYRARLDACVGGGQWAADFGGEVKVIGIRPADLWIGVKDGVGGMISGAQAPELIRWKRSLVYRCHWPQDAQRWWI